MPHKLTLVVEVVALSRRVDAVDGVVVAVGPRRDVRVLVGERVWCEEAHGHWVVPAGAVVVPGQAAQVVPRLARVPVTPAYAAHHAQHGDAAERVAHALLLLQSFFIPHHLVVIALTEFQDYL